MNAISGYLSSICLEAETEPTKTRMLSTLLHNSRKKKKRKTKIPN